jgi:hypothetical protein
MEEPLTLPNRKTIEATKYKIVANITIGRPILCKKIIWVLG